MPYKNVWVKPDVFMRYKGVVIYYTYRHDDVNDSIGEYHFTTDEMDTDYKEDDDGSGALFDVRDLETWQEPPHPEFIDLKMSPLKKERLEKEWCAYHDSDILIHYIKKAIRNAIKHGHCASGRMLTKANQ